MTSEVIKGELERMTGPERAKVQGYLRILRWKETPGLADALAGIHAKMDAGRKVNVDYVESMRRVFRCEEPGLGVYRYVLDEQVFEQFVALAEDEADLLGAFFRWLAAHPSSTGDGSHLDAAGRVNFASLCGPFLVVHWPDHAVREVRVVQIRRE